MASYRKTSAEFLIDHIEDECDSQANGKKKHALAGDVYIKAWSYAMLNKVFFFLSLFGSLALILWPAIMVLKPEICGIKISDLSMQDAAIIQTVLTALTGFFIYLYRYYKSRQMFTENLLRYIAFTSHPIDELANRVIEGMEKLDKGFTFSTAEKNGNTEKDKTEE